MQGHGFLAIWSDVTAQQETDYLHWLTREHTAERVSTAGFLSVRVFRALLPGICRFFILYELEEPDVLGGPAYLARLNAPTPWSQRIMPILGNFIRGGGRLVAAAGTGQGGYLAALRLEDVPASDAAQLVSTLVQSDRIAAVRLLETDAAQTSIPTREKSMRAQDRSFRGLLLIEGLDGGAVRACLNRLPTFAPDLDPPTAEPIYVGFFGLDRRGLPDGSA